MRFQWCTATGVFLALSLPTSAAAESSLRQSAAQSTALKWEMGYLALTAIDTAQTIDCLHRGMCVEGNPIFGKHPSNAKLIISKVALGAAHFAVFSRLNNRNPHAALRFVQGSVLMQGGVVALNARFLF